ALTIWLAGITGKFGRILSLKLLEKPNLVLGGYARDPSKVPTALAGSPRLQLFKGEAFDDATIKPFVSGCDVVVCAYLGADDLMVDRQKKLSDARDETGVPRYAHLETKSTVKGIHILIGGFMDPVLSPFFQVWDPKNRTLRYWGEGTEPWEGTSYANAAEFTAVIIADTSAVGIKKYLGDRKTIRQIASTFDMVYGLMPKMERLGSLDNLKARMRAKQA
ncbi:hypothetical protein N657DRAFT_574658, partial [Parathielavia appendiculata]